ncbi:hypothetical protein ACOME3_001898 [Neoechinorhynchus agilis]
MSATTDSVFGWQAPVCSSSPFRGKVAIIVDLTVNNRVQMEDFRRNIPEIVFDVIDKIRRSSIHLMVSAHIFNTKGSSTAITWKRIQSEQEVSEFEATLVDYMLKFFKSDNGAPVDAESTPTRKLVSVLQKVTRQTDDWQPRMSSPRHIAVILTPSHATNQFDSNVGVFELFNFMYKTFVVSIHADRYHAHEKFILTDFLKDSGTYYRGRKYIDSVVKGALNYWIHTTHCEKKCSSSIDCTANLRCTNGNCDCPEGQVMSPGGGICYVDWYRACNIDQVCMPGGICLDGVCQYKLPDIICERSCENFSRPCPRTIY